MTKYLFSDFDNTLRNSKVKNSLKIDQKDLDFVKEFQKNNKLIVSTGRPYKQLKEHLLSEYNLLPDYFIVNTGAMVCDNKGEVFYKKTIDQNIKTSLLDFLKTIVDQIDVIVFATPENESFLFHKNWTKDVGKFFFGLEKLDKTLDYLYDKDLLCLKIECKQQTWDKIEDFIKKNNLEVNITFNSINNKLFNEIHGFKVSKGQAIKGLQKRLNISNKDIIVAGDDYNDISMFEMFYDNSYMCKHEHNKNIRNKAKYLIDNIWEIKY
ncbi:Cof-type HAD-IIB family hydrolase [Mycoplasma feriruminatoris]|uniref:Cof-type HAD-IIB family hydrolase n=1 Tax=Mycoplasma feriruminatoris TaxID=1179777 RepID=UPI0002A4D33F|nr:Cof-type HAD-IIB family hydrolase [Mycoplasma feriruminatoris]UKS54557.1 HAD hydrolase, IIB family protein [Mycoplasma feriruminatoris]VZK65737.1 HMP-PP phosphatase [Mycoplasma feriruminatoris]VZR75878.1 HMP-PP phosphatase [Mycoplasma feriruminatoris]VZR98695.1 HMP-PP phosphatase [Mycoplasma feriruminatoris]